MHGGASFFVEVNEPGSAQFAARLRKVFKERSKWAKKEHIFSYRIYDADLPDYAVAIDWYSEPAAPQAGCLVIAEYAAPKSVDPDLAQRRFNDVLSIAPAVTGVDPSHVFGRRRLREKGGSQYSEQSKDSKILFTEEAGLTFEVDLSKRLDTGLFLDHRLTRALVREAAWGKDVLNLFAYTGSASVYAAAGGAASITTVDLSQTYLDWAKRNMAKNGFNGPGHEFIKADVMPWITETRRTSQRFDFIFVDPPTFSNSKAMGSKVWDVQKDHCELLIGCSRLLRPGGWGIFSCNLRSFKADLETLNRYGVCLEDISQSSIPEDFARNPKIHRCFKFNYFKSC